METKNDRPRPFFVSPPGSTMQDELEERQIAPADLAQALGWSMSDLDALLAGQTPLDAELARQLEAFFGISVGYWLNHERAYRQRIAEEARQAS